MPANSVGLYRIALSLTRNERDAEDLLQDTALSAWRMVRTLEAPERFTAWLCRIVVNHGRTLLRSRRRHPVVSMEGLDGEFDGEGHRLGVVPAWPGSVEDTVEQRRLATRVVALSQRLPEPYLEIWTLADVEQLTMDEIAEVLGLSVPNTKTRLHRARLALRKLLAEELLPPVRGET
jgi:RNA polymerase sigma-70 factor (ECF subfamily)